MTEIDDILFLGCITFGPIIALIVNLFYLI